MLLMNNISSNQYIDIEEEYIEDFSNTCSSNDDCDHPQEFRLGLCYAPYSCRIVLELWFAGDSMMWL